ncbi:MAG: flagellar export protein FliJ [Chitinivibrionales bacterium]|nr:flagellar export protein FliJ [Chitinivibrionales bacterium]MBD3397013.1 flagellar export protein FliJ [Chitinivibrionales bacterium]
MQRFRFNLQTLLELRRRKEDAVKLDLARKRGKVKQAQQELGEIGRELTEVQKQQKDSRQTSNVDSWRRGVAYRHKLKTDMLKKGRQVDDLKAEAEHIRKELVKATQQVRALELLRERRYAEWRKEYGLEEQGFIDDVSQQGFIRRKKAAAGRADA